MIINYQRVHNTPVTCWTAVFLSFVKFSSTPGRDIHSFTCLFRYEARYTCDNDIWPLPVTLTLDIGTYKWYLHHRFVMLRVSMKCHEILFNHFKVVVRTRKTTYLSEWVKGALNPSNARHMWHWPLLVTLEVGTCKWYATHHLVMMHVSMKFHKFLFNCLKVVVSTKKTAYLTFELYWWPWPPGRNL